MRQSADAVHDTVSRCDVLVIAAAPGGRDDRGVAGRARTRCGIDEKARIRAFILVNRYAAQYALFERLGVPTKSKRSACQYGAEFVSPVASAAVTFDFANAVDKSFPNAYQVRARSSTVFCLAMRRARSCRHRRLPRDGVEFRAEGPR